MYVPALADEVAFTLRHPDGHFIRPYRQVGKPLDDIAPERF
jgi:hypothetical protein